jgi:AraC-like DNA-binding protein
MLPDLEHVPAGPGRSFATDRFDLVAFPYRWHFHAAYELTLITAGAGRRFVGDSIEWFGPGDLVLLGPHLPHTWHSEPCRGSRSRAVVIRFEADCLGAEFFDCGELRRIRGLLERSRRGLAFDATPARCAVAKVLTSGAAAPPFAQLITLLESLQLLATKGPGRTLASPSYVWSPRANDTRRIDRVCRHVMQHLAEPLALADVAAVAGLAPGSFSRFFRRMTGRTFVGWLHEMRIGHACRLLSTTDQPVVEIAFASGFGNLANFNRIFRRLRQCTPRQLRRRLDTGPLESVPQSGGRGRAIVARCR